MDARGLDRVVVGAPLVALGLHARAVRLALPRVLPLQDPPGQVHLLQTHQEVASSLQNLQVQEWVRGSCTQSVVPGVAQPSKAPFVTHTL